MKNPTRATGEAMPAINRRALLTSATAMAVAAIPTISAEAATDPVSREVGDLLERWCALKDEDMRLSRAYSAASAKMPEWARPGHQFVGSDGTPCGPMVGFPELANWTPSERRGVSHNIRPSLRDVLSRYQLHMPRTPCPARTEARQAAFAAARRWIARKREQELERVAVGLSQINEASMENDDAIAGVWSRFDALANSPGNLDLIAAHLYMELRESAAFAEAEEDLEWEDKLHLLILRNIAGMTTGKIHSIVIEALATAGRSA